MSELRPDSELKNIFRPNAVYAWFLNKWFRKRGVDSRLVMDNFHKPVNARQLKRAGYYPQIADHTIVTSYRGYFLILNTPGYYEKLRNLTRDKIVNYLCSDYHTGKSKDRVKYFDHILTQVEPHPNRHKKYIYVGWGADPEYCYPEKGEKAVYLDCLMHGYYEGKYDYIYDIYQKVLPRPDIKLIHPIPVYRGVKRMGWLKHQKLVRAAHFYCLTQPGEGGLTRIEAATGGALLVVPEAFSKLRIISSLERRVWTTKEDLIKILEKPFSARAIRKKALEHSWDKTVDRILKVLEGDG